MDDTTRANGYKHGRPEGRDVKPADEIVRKVIEALPAETRLYPDVYAWQVTDALEAATSSPAVDREALAREMYAADFWGDENAHRDWDEFIAHPVHFERYRARADALLASGILRDVRDVQAEALEQAANSGDFNTHACIGLNRRAQAIREARSERD